MFFIGGYNTEGGDRIFLLFLKNGVFADDRSPFLV